MGSVAYDIVETRSLWRDEIFQYLDDIKGQSTIFNKENKNEVRVLNYISTPLKDKIMPEKCQNIISFPGVSVTEYTEITRNVDLIDTYQQDILSLERKVKDMEAKLKKAVPTHTISFMCFNVFLFTVFFVLLYFKLKFNLYTINPFYIISLMLMSITLFLTALVSLKDWREFLNGR